METKKCTCCGQVKPISEFSKKSRNKDGLDTNCKSCRNAKNKKYRDENKEKFNAKRKEYYQENREHILEQKKKYTDSHKQEKAEYDKVYRQQNKERLRKQKNEWAKNSLEYKIINNIRRRVAHALKGESKSEHTMSLIGCDIEFLKEYISSMFSEGMSWDNYGEWHLDHIRPCSSFDLSNPDEQKECFNYKNLQPLWAIDNLKKAYKYEVQTSNSRG